MGLDTNIYHSVRRRNSKDKLEVVRNNKIRYFRKHWFWVDYFEAENCVDFILTEDKINKAIGDIKDKLKSSKEDKLDFIGSCLSLNTSPTEEKIDYTLKDYISTLEECLKIIHSDSWDDYDQIVIHNWW